MSLLETQYQNYLKENPDSKLNFEEWQWQVWRKTPPYVSDNFQIGPDGAFEYDDDISDWDATLMDGLDEDI